MIISYNNLYKFTHTIFKSIGCSDEDATTAAKALLAADTRGIDSHGVARLSGYVRLWEAKRVNAKPKIKIVHVHPDHTVYVLQGGTLAVTFNKVDRRMLELKPGDGFVSGSLSDAGKNIGTTTVKLLVTDIYRPRIK